MTRLILYSMLMMAVTFGALVALPGCATTGDERPIFSAADIQIILEETQIAVEEYLAVTVPDPTPAQQLAISAGRVLVRIMISKLREAGMYADATRLEIKAGLAEPVAELEPLE